MTEREKALRKRLELLDNERHAIESEIRELHSNDMIDIKRKVISEHKKYLYRAFVERGEAYNMLNKEYTKGTFLIIYVPNDASPYVLSLFVNGIVSGLLEVKLFDCADFHDQPRKVVKENEIYDDYKKQMHIRGNAYSEISVDEFFEAYDIHLAKMDELATMIANENYTNEFVEMLGEMYPCGFLGRHIVRSFC